MARDVVIVGAARTPIGAFQGALSSLKAPELGAVAIKAALERAGVKAELVEQIFMGHVLQAGVGQAPARQAARFAPSRWHPGRHRSQGVRVWSAGRRQRVSGDRARRGRCRRRWRHGVDVERSVPLAHDAQRRPHGPRRVQGLDGPRWPHRRVRQRAHGHLRRGVRDRHEDLRAPRRTSSRSSRRTARSARRRKGSSRTRSSACRWRRRRATRSSCSKMRARRTRSPRRSPPSSRSSEGRHRDGGERFVDRRRRRSPRADER